MTPLEQLQDRVGKGIEWLVANDPGGTMHLWFEAGLTPLSPMPAQEADRKEEYRAYYSARRTFERLDNELARAEKRDPVKLPDPWLPPKGHERDKVRVREKRR